MTQYILGISGLGRNSLPYESLLSSLWYIAWRNAFNAVDLYAYIGAKRAPSKTDSFIYPPRWIDGSKIAAQFGINLPDAYEINHLATIERCRGRWLSNTIRACPICLEHGYHSYWHQLHDLYECPVHQCRIVETCQSCGASLPWYGFSKSLFNNPYCCPVCKRAISGTEPFLDFFNEFRSHHNELINNFEPWRKWVEEKERKCKNLCNASISMDRALWCRHDGMKRELGRICHPTPGSESRFSTAGIEVLSWRVQINIGLNQIELRKTRYRYWVNPVWAVFIRRMILWIFGSTDNPRIFESRLEFNMRDDVIKLDRISELEIALWILMYAEGISIVCDGTFRLCQKWSPILSEIEFEYINGNVPRTGLMYGLLGLAAGLILTIRMLARKTGTLNVHEVRSFQLYWINIWSSCAHERSMGAVAFPRIEGLPVRWSAAIKQAYIERYRPGGPLSQTRPRQEERDGDS